MRPVILILIVLLLIAPLSAQPTPDEETMPPDILYTHQLASGNRFVPGTSTFPQVTYRDISLPGVPAWVLGLPVDAPRWRVVLGDGSLFELDWSGGVTALETTPVASPPAITTLGVALIRPLDSSLRSHLMPLNEGLIYIAANGDLVWALDSVERDRLIVNAPLDGRIAIASDGRAALYVDATDQRYVHGVLGDALEGSALLIVRIEDERLQVVERIELAGDAVYEGLMPFWADLNSDGRDDLVTTVSDGDTGSRLRAYITTDEAMRAVDGPAIGRGGRWQNQLGWGPFGPDGENLLVDVRTPHIGGIVRFYRYTGEALEIIAERPGYTSHVIGSRNLDLGIAGDFDGDGQPEVVLPTQDLTRIAGLALTTEGVVERWSLPLDGWVVSNLSAQVWPGGGLSLAVGLNDGRVRIYAPES